MRRGQTTLEYIIIIGVVAAGIIAGLIYISRGHQGNLRSQADQLGAIPYAPGRTTINNSERRTISSVANAGSSSSVLHGNLNEVNKVLEGDPAAPAGSDARLGLLQRISDQIAAIYELLKLWEIEASTEAPEVATTYRDGTALSGDDHWITFPETGLMAINEQLKTAGDTLKTLNEAAEASQDAFEATPRTPDKSTSTSYSNESGTAGTYRHTDETLGDY